MTRHRPEPTTTPPTPPTPLIHPMIFELDLDLPDPSEYTQEELFLAIQVHLKRIEELSKAASDSPHGSSEAGLPSSGLRQRTFASTQGTSATSSVTSGCIDMVMVPINKVKAWTAHNARLAWNAISSASTAFTHAFPDAQSLPTLFPTIIDTILFRCDLAKVTDNINLPGMRTEWDRAVLVVVLSGILFNIRLNCIVWLLFWCHPALVGFSGLAMRVVWGVSKREMEPAMEVLVA